MIRCGKRRNDRVVATLVLAIAGCDGAIVGDRALVSTIPTTIVEPPANFVRELKADGTLSAVEAVPLVAPAEARGAMKVAWVVADGTVVAPGDAVVRFDPTEIQRQLENGKDDARAAEQSIRKATVEGASKRLKRDITAVLADDEAGLARSFLPADERVFSRNEILESRIDIDLAEAKATHSRSVMVIETDVTANEVEIHRIAGTHAQAEVGRATETLAKLEITASGPGIVVLDRNWRGDTLRLGDTVWPGQKVAELAQVSALQADLFVLEADAAQLVAGLPATVELEARPELAYAATVKRVDTLAKPRHPDVPVHYFGVTLALATTNNNAMRVGQRVRAVITIEQPDALVLPRQAVFELESRTVVYRQDGPGFAPTDVILGVASPGRVVVESGVQAGDVVALRDPTRTAAPSESDAQAPASSKLGGSR